MGVLGGGLLNSSGASSSGGALNGEELEFVGDSGAGATALNGGVKTSGAGDFTVFGIDSISIAPDASAVTMNASGLRAVAIGHDCTASGISATAMGDTSIVTGNYSTAIGYNSRMKSANGVAIGVSAGTTTTTATGAVAIGYNSGQLNGSASVSVGQSSYAQGDSSISIGRNAICNASGDEGISIGAYSDCQGIGAVAIGGDSATGARALSLGSIAIGGDDTSNGSAYAHTGANAVAIGAGAEASAANAWQFGVGINSTANSLQISGMSFKSSTYSVFGTSTPDANKTVLIDRDFSSTGSSYALQVGGIQTLTGGTSSPSGAKIGSQITVNSGNTHSVAACVEIPALNLTMTSGTVTNGSSLYIAGAPTTATNNYAMLVDAGQAKFAASTTAGASVLLPHGTAPTSPVNGEMWTTTAGLYVRINGSTVGPLS